MLREILVFQEAECGVNRDGQKARNMYNVECTDCGRDSKGAYNSIDCWLLAGHFNVAVGRYVVGNILRSLHRVRITFVG